MKTFLLVILGVLVAQMILLGTLLLVVASRIETTPEVKSGTVLIQALEGDIPESPPVGGLPFSDALSHAEILENFEKAAADDRIRAVVLRLSGPSMGFARMEELRSAVARVRDAGKPVWGYTEFLDRGALLLGSACDSLYLMPTGYVSLHGMASERMFFGSALDKLGVDPQLDKIGQYKSAAEMMTRTDLSAAARENTQWILDALYPGFLRTVAESRPITAQVLEDSVLGRAAMIPEEVRAAGLVDRLIYWDEVEALLLAVDGVEVGKEDDKAALAPRPRRIGGEAYGKVPRKSAGLHPKKRIAVVHAQGLIAGEESGMSWPLGMTMGAATLETAFREAAGDKKVEAIVFRVNSNGGESSTSWRIQRAAVRAAAAKPMVTSIADVAASGGYLICYPCEPILAGPHSIVGSIGSISGKINMRGLYDKLGVTKDFVTRGPNALMDSDYFDYTPEQWAAFQERHMADYQQWVTDIALHREMAPAAVDSVGRGRVWTGEQALAHGLIDGLGGYEDAIAAARVKAGIPEDEDVDIVHYPKKLGPLEALRRGGFVAALHALVDKLFVGGTTGTWAVDWAPYPRP